MTEKVETKSLKDIFMNVKSQFKEIWPKLNPLVRMTSLFNNLRAHEDGPAIIEAGWRAIVNLTGGVISNRRERPWELSDNMLHELAPGVTSEQVDAAVEAGRVHEMTVRNKTEAFLAEGAFQNGQILLENARTVAGMVGAEIREAGLGNLVKIGVDTAKDLIEAAKVFGINLKEKAAQSSQKAAVPSVT